MLRIIIMLDSADGPDGDRELGRIEIVNDGTGTEEHGNYNVRLYNGNYDVRLYSGKEAGWKPMNWRIDSFPRSLGPLDLLYRALQDVVNKDVRR